VSHFSIMLWRTRLRCLSNIPLIADLHFAHMMLLYLEFMRSIGPE
jgi:4-hydroxy-3-methylbut-2-en-1-yl diphosphate synthase IspG/GcpE